MDNNIEIKSSKTKKARKPKKVDDKKTKSKTKIKINGNKKEKNKNTQSIKFNISSSGGLGGSVAAVHHLFQFQYKHLTEMNGSAKMSKSEIY